MSQLKIFNATSKEFRLNVTQFRSPMNASINSVQTKTMLQHFPIRCGQPDINFTVRYASLDDKHSFESFVRQHMLDTKNITKDDDKALTLWWPERNIENWTGYITAYTVTEKRFEVAPAATFGVALVDSMMSEKTTLATRSVDIWKILGIQIPEYRGYDDLMLIPPTPPSSNNPTNSETRPGSAPTLPRPINSGDAPL
jgi:hypothetical protein